MSVKKDWIAPLALLFVSFIWGATFVVVQNAMSFVGPFTFNGIRFFIRWNHFIIRSNDFLQKNFKTRYKTE